MDFHTRTNRIWRKGYTTGSCAAAAAKASLSLLLNNSCPPTTTITTPQGVQLVIPLAGAELRDDIALCRVVKDGGDDPDVTNGAVIEAAVNIEAYATGQTTEIIICGGRGVGKVTKPGLSLPVGSAAINPVPCQMISSAISELVPENYRIRVEIRVEDGEKIAQKTMNPQLGIIGGISILGTTGIVEPMSEEAFKSSLIPQITVAQASGMQTLILTPGQIGRRHAIEQCGLPEQAVILTSNFIGFLLEECVRHQVKQVILFGHLGKLIKVAGGIFHTHNRVADARMEILAAQASLQGASQAVITKIMDCITVEAALEVIADAGLQAIYRQLAVKAGERAERFVYQEIQIGVVLTDLKGNLLGWNPQAEKIGGELHWHIQSK